MYEVREYVGNYNKSNFYSIMGKFFAERIYRKKIPYLINDKDKAWYLFYQNKELIGFCGIKIRQHYTSFSDIYILEKHYSNKVLTYITNYMFNLYKMENIKLLTCSKEEIKIWKDLGFKIIGNKGCYLCMLWEAKHEN